MLVYKMSLLWVKDSDIYCKRHQSLFSATKLNQIEKNELCEPYILYSVQWLVIDRPFVAQLLLGVQTRAFSSSSLGWFSTKRYSSILLCSVDFQGTL